MRVGNFLVDLWPNILFTLVVLICSGTFDESPMVGDGTNHCSDDEKCSPDAKGESQPSYLEERMIGGQIVFWKIQIDNCDAKSDSC